MTAPTVPIAVVGWSVMRPGSPSPCREDLELGEACREDGVPDRINIRTLSGEWSKPEGMQRWSRLDRYGRAVVDITNRTIKTRQGDDQPETGLYAASARSCHETNSTYDRELIEKGPERASPRLFPYTLPGSTLSEAAMHLNLTGPYVVFPGGPACALTAFAAATDSIDVGHAERLCVVAADVLGPATLRHLIEADATEPAAVVPAEGAAAMWLAPPDDSLRGPRLLARTSLGPSNADATHWRAMVNECSMGEPGYIVVATERAEAARQQALILNELFPETECIQLVWNLGQMGAPLGLAALISTLEEQKTSLVVASDPCGSAACFISPD